MTAEAKYEVALALTNGFHEEVGPQGIQLLYTEYITNLALSTPKNKDSFPSIKTFKARLLRCYIVLRLLESNYNHYFLDLDQNQIAGIMGISPKEYNTVFNKAIKKLKVLKLKQTRSLLEDSLQNLEILEYTSKTEEQPHPDE